MLNSYITFLKNDSQLDDKKNQIRKNVGGKYYSSLLTREIKNIGKKYHILHNMYDS